MKGRTILACIAVATAIIATATATAFAANKSGFRTGQPSMLDPGQAGRAGHAAHDGRRPALEWFSL